MLELLRNYYESEKCHNFFTICGKNPFLLLLRQHYVSALIRNLKVMELDQHHSFQEALLFASEKLIFLWNTTLNKASLSLRLSTSHLVIQVHLPQSKCLLLKGKEGEDHFHLTYCLILQMLEEIFGICIHIFSKGLFFLSQDIKEPPSNFADILLRCYIYFVLRVIPNRQNLDVSGVFNRALIIE